jgi:hypothetical protein
VILFIGVALMAGGLAGSLVRSSSFSLPHLLSSSLYSSLLLTSRFQSWWRYWTHELTSQTVLILKYIIPDYTGYLYYGGANVAMNGGIMISYVPSPSFSPLLLSPDIHFSSSFANTPSFTSLPRCCQGNC